jgi:hypothetical protein
MVVLKVGCFRLGRLGARGVPALHRAAVAARQGALGARPDHVR